MTATDALVLVLAGLAAATLGTAGGITSLVSYPALLAVGVPALQADVVNLVALTVCWPGSAIASRRELPDLRRWLRPLGLAAAVGGGAGTALLLTTPPGVFADVVPYLVAAGSCALLLQPRLTARRASRPAAKPATVAGVAAGLSVYGGYFGAGSGVMLLAASLVFVDARLAHANAIKNMMVGAAAVTSAVILAAAGPVRWTAVLPLAAGSFAGSLVGPGVARRVPAPVVRWTVGLLGLGFAVALALT